LRKKAALQVGSAKDLAENVKKLLDPKNSALVEMYTLNAQSILKKYQNVLNEYINIIKPYLPKD
jgi:3-deoxy-D-manno-octulosonic-acid transferase